MAKHGVSLPKGRGLALQSLGYKDQKRHHMSRKETSAQNTAFKNRHCKYPSTIFGHMQM